MSFESLFKPGVENPEENLTVEQAIQAAKDKIAEKTINPEEAKFFIKGDQKNLRFLRARDPLGTFQISRELMLVVKKDPHIIDKRIKFFYPKTG